MQFVKNILHTDGDRRRTVQAFPVGAVMQWYSATPPTGWLVCNGQQVPINTYNSLYNVLTANATVFPYGTNTDGNSNAGSSHFRLPDMTDRYIKCPTKSGTNPGSSYVATTGGTTTHRHLVSMSLSANTDTSGSSHYHGWTPGSLGSGGSTHTHSGNVGTGVSSPAPNLNRPQTGATEMIIASHSHTMAFSGDSGGGAHTHSTSGQVGNTTSDSHSHTLGSASGSVNTNSGTHTPPAMRTIFVVYTGALS